MEHQLSLHNDIKEIKLDVSRLQENVNELNRFKTEVKEWMNETALKVNSIEESDAEQSKSLMEFEARLKDTNVKLDQALYNNYKSLSIKAILIFAIILLLYKSIQSLMSPVRQYPDRLN
jgi:chromosome segregation ATPase